MLIIYTLGTTTFLIFGLIPLGLAFIVIEYRNIPYRLNNRRIFLNTTGFLFIQLWINFYLAISLILIQPNILSSDYSSQSFFVTWVISTAYCLGSILLNIFLGWKWTKYNLEKPYMLHWAIGYLFYFVIIGLGIIIIQTIDFNSTFRRGICQGDSLSFPPVSSSVKYNYY